VNADPDGGVWINEGGKTSLPEEEIIMKRTRFAAGLLCLLIGSTIWLHAYTSAPQSNPAVPGLSQISAAKAMEQIQWAAAEGKPEGPTPLQIAVLFLQIRPDQLTVLEQLLQARQAAATPLIAGIRQTTQQLEALLNSGGNPAEAGALVIRIHVLQQQVAQAQQEFLTKFVALLDAEQRQKLEAVRLATQLQPVAPAFQQLHLF